MEAAAESLGHPGGDQGEATRATGSGYETAGVEVNENHVHGVIHSPRVVHRWSPTDLLRQHHEGVGGAGGDDGVAEGAQSV